MSTQHKVVTLLKGFITLIAMATILAIVPHTALAQGGVNTSPDLAIPLADEVNEGSLNPLEQHWYRFTPAGPDVPGCFS